jgi:hypothetical protein
VTRLSRGCSREHRKPFGATTRMREPHGPRRGRVRLGVRTSAAACAVHATPSSGRSTRRAAQRRPHQATHTRCEPRQRPPRKGSDETPGSPARGCRGGCSASLVRSPALASRAGRHGCDVRVRLVRGISHTARDAFSIRSPGGRTGGVAIGPA